MATAGFAGASLPVNAESDELARRTRTIIEGAFCTCGCGSHLPSDAEDACFGCSVGKSDVSFVRRSLREGRSAREIMLALGEPVTISLFGDYDDPGLSELWQLATRVANEFDQHRVVVRTPARSASALLALKVVECAREVDRFAPVRDAMIQHEGPWDEHSLLALGVAKGLDARDLAACLPAAAVRGQIEKDTLHARLAKIRRFPALSVNGEAVWGGEAGLREAVHAAIREGSI